MAVVRTGKALVRLRSSPTDDIAVAQPCNGVEALKTIFNN